MSAIDTTAAMERLADFVNTRDVLKGHDDVATPEQLRAWLQQRELLDEQATVSAADLKSAHALREGLRTALLAHDAHEDAPPAEEFVATTVPLQLVISAGGEVQLVPARDGVAAALAILVADIPAAVGDGTWLRTKACPRDECQWAFVDRSRNRSRRWCSMEVCGNVEKTRSFRQRQRSD